MGMYEQISANKWKSAMLVSLFIVIILALGFFIGYLLTYNSQSGALAGGLLGLVVATIVAVGMALFSYYKSDSAALMMAGAREATHQEFPYFVNTVEGLAIAAGLPAPKTYIIETDAMNAFATGRDPQHASVAVTRGLLERCNRLELEGVLAHEMSHIKDYDIRLMCMVVVLVGFIVIASEIMLRMLFWGGVGGQAQQFQRRGRRAGRDLSGDHDRRPGLPRSFHLSSPGCCSSPSPAAGSTWPMPAGPCSPVTRRVWPEPWRN